MQGDKNKPAEKEQECRQTVFGVQLLFDGADPARGKEDEGEKNEQQPGRRENPKQQAGKEAAGNL